MFDFKFTPQLWYSEKAEEAARFYVSLFPDSRIDYVGTLATDTPGGPPGSVQVVEFTLAGQPFLAFASKQMEPFTHAVSFIYKCADQAELDRLWDALGKGGQHEMCGWLKDRYGVSWQLVPKDFLAMMRDKDRTKAKRVTEAMLKMKKLDAAELKRAYDGTGR